MKKLLVVLALATFLAAAPVLAQEYEEGIVETPRPAVTEFDKKYPALLDPIDQPIIIIPPDNVAPKADAAGSGGESEQASMAITLSGPSQEAGAVLSLGRPGAGKASSSEQEIRRSIRRLIRQLG